MSFILLFEFLGTHIPELGAFLCFAIVETGLTMLVYKLAYNASGKAWKALVKQNPQIIKQSIVEEYELQAARLKERIRWLEERHDAMVPALRGMGALLDRVVKDE